VKGARGPGAPVISGPTRAVEQARHAEKPFQNPAGGRPSTDSAAASRYRTGGRNTPLAARGEPFVWLTGAGLVVATLMILALLGLVLVNGGRTFWPRAIAELTLTDGTVLLGEVTRTERYRPTEGDIATLPPAARARLILDDGWSRRRLLRTGNYDLYGEDFRWVNDHSIVSERLPADAWMIERREWGPAIGRPAALTRDESTVASGAAQILEKYGELHALTLTAADRIHHLEKDEIGEINYASEKARLAVRRAAIDHGEGSREHAAAAREAAALEDEFAGRYRSLQEQIATTRQENARYRFVVREAGGRVIPESPGAPDTPMLVSQVVRAYPANALGTGGRLMVYLDRWKEYLTWEPREANTEGGVLPAIFGTFMMTVLMSLAVAPFGIVTALYLREYARQGTLVSAVRIAVNNLAGVPSIVFGVFGLGFFCYALGGSLDAFFYPEKLPAPTFGTGGILWASLTLALLTVPVVIVATEEALAAVPRSLREGSFGCGASRWQTIWRIVLPRATPGIMTGLILAMARGAGEVAPLMLTGVVKLAPELPFDGHFPFFHLERSFMHLGFHIYDVGFQSRNSEAGKPMVFTTTLLLIALIALLNLTAISLRSRLRRRFKSDNF